MGNLRCGSVVCLTRCLLCLVGCVLAIGFLPPIRNRALFFWPRAWRPLSTHQALRMYMDTATGNGKAALSACTELRNNSKPQDAQSTHHPPTIKLARLTEPRQVQTDTAQYATARSFVENAGDDRAKFAAFLPQMTPADKSSLLSLWSVLHSALTERGISYFFIEGSLLGAVRHKGFIPWDDDMDVGVDLANLSLAQRVLSCVPGYTLRIEGKRMWKFFPENGTAVFKLPSSKVHHPRQLTEREKSVHVDDWVSTNDVVQRYPFIDIFFFKNDDEYVWANAGFVAATSMFKKDDVYPLTTAAFEGFLAPVPRRSDVIIKNMYDVNSCWSPGMYHKIGLPIRNRTIVPCQDLSQMYSIRTV